MKTLAVCAGLTVFVCCSSALIGQETTRRVTGRVLETPGGAPIPAASVRIVNTTVGAATNDSGAFMFRAPAGALSLQVRRIGYKSVTVPLGADQSDLTVSLERDVLKLDEEVITGVATTISSKNSANDVAVLNADQINQVPSPTIENALQGKIAGAVIQQNNGGAPGGGMQIQIRGVTSINSNASPLYVIDGVIVNNETVNSDANAISAAAGGNLPSNQDNNANRIADLNPNDIETIEVLKGSSAAAIYGSKAASGVVIITTKRGLPGAPQWELNGQAGTYMLANSLNLRQFPTYASANAWWKNDHHASTDLPLAMYGGPQNFQDQLFGGGQLSGSGDLSVRGATNATNYYADVHDQYDNGIMLGTYYRKQGARTNLTETFSSAFQVSTNLYYQHSVTARGITGNDNVGVSPYNIFSSTPQFFKMNQFSNGAWVTNPFGLGNTFADAAEEQTPTTVNRFIGGGTATLQVLHSDAHDLHLSLIGGVDLTGQTDLNYSPPSLQLEQNKSLVGTSTVGQANDVYYNYSLSLIHHFTGSTFIDATTSLGVSQDRRTLDNPITIGQALPPGILTPTSAEVITSVENKTDTKTMSLYAQEQILTLAQRLSLTAGLTADRNSNNGSYSAYHIYPKFAGSFRIPTFAGFVDELKLRAAYGRSGTAPNYGLNYPANSSFTSLVNGGSHALASNFNVAQVLFEIQNDTHLKPETSTEIESGIDLTLFRSKLQFSGTVYQKRVSDLVLLTAPAASSGLSQVILNGGQFTNQGIELSLQASPIADSRGFTWIMNNTFYRNYSRVDALPIPPFPSQYGFGGAFGLNTIQVGRSVSQIVNSGKLGKDGQPIQVGDATPSDVMSFNQEISYKGLHLSGVLDWYVGGNTSNITNAYYDNNGPFLLADSAAISKRLVGQQAGNTVYVESARFVKLREIRLSYDLPASWVKAIGSGHLRSARIDVSGRNLFMSFPYTGLDPEVSVFGNLQTARGQDITAYPPSKSIFFGVDLGL